MTDHADLLRRIQLSIDGFARGEHVSTWVNNELLKEAKAEIDRLHRNERDWLAANGPGGWIDDLRRGSRGNCICHPPVFTEYSATVYLPDPKCPAHGGVKHIMFVGEKRAASASSPPSE
jgi:hypothetical protein